MFPELIEYQTQVLGMIFLVLRENQNVIEIDQNEVIGVGLKMKFIMRENVGGALARPKDMTVYSYEPKLVLNAVLGISCSRIRI